jgi:2-hydroxyacyl-CoA lyase 1
VHNFIERTQIPFLRSPIGKGVIPDEHPLAVSAARTLVLQNADVVFLMGARFNWILHPGFRRSRLRSGAALCQGCQGHTARHRARNNWPTEVALVGPRVRPSAGPRTGAGKAIMQQMNAALGGRQWFHPKESPWRQMIAQKTADNVATIKPQVEDDTALGGYYRLLRDIAQWMPRNSVLSAEGAGTMDIGLAMLPSFNARPWDRC